MTATIRMHRAIACGAVSFRWLAILSVTVASTVYAVDGTNVNGVVWAHSYEGDVTPSLNTPTISETGGFSGSTDGSVLTISNGLAQLIGGAGDPNWDGSAAAGSTFETRIKIDSQTGGIATGFEIGNLYGYAGLQIKTSGVTAAGASSISYALDGTAWHIYRMILSNNVVRYYVDNGPSPFATMGMIALPYDAFDFGGTYAGGGVSEFDYVRWTNDGAFAPLVPEPGALGLMVVAGAIVWHRRKR